MLTTIISLGQYLIAVSTGIIVEKISQIVSNSKICTQNSSSDGGKLYWLILVRFHIRDNFVIYDNGLHSRWLTKIVSIIFKLKIYPNLVICFCWLVRVSLFIDLVFPWDLGKGWWGHLSTFMISRPTYQSSDWWKFSTWNEWLGDNQLASSIGNFVGNAVRNLVGNFAGQGGGEKPI